MTAIEFVKEFGLERGKAASIMHIADFSRNFDLPMSNLIEIREDLKQIVDAWELVESYSGLAIAKRQYSCFTNACESVGVNKSPRVLALGRAISLVEQC